MADGFDVFVSYGHEDQPWVRTLAENLERAGLHVFYDEWEIGAGDVLVHRLDTGIRTSTHGILVVSPHALSRPWVAEEYAAMVTRAVAGRQRLIPVLLRDADLPPLLASRVWVDFRHVHEPAAYTARVGELVDALRGHRPGRPAPDGTVSPPSGLAYQAEGPRTVALRVGRDTVTLTGAQVTTAGRPAGMDWRADQVLAELDRVRSRRPAGQTAVKAPATGAGPAADPVDGALRATGRMLGERFLPAEVATALAGEVDAAVRGGVPLLLALEVTGEAGLADLPWETLTLPGQARPLVLHPSVRLHRAVTGLGATPAMGIPGPLRILAVIASPDHGGGVLLDYEAELSRILDAVEPARRAGRAYVRILNWGSREAIRAALKQERFHILHISCHAGPGSLDLETDDGALDRVNAEVFVEQVLVPNQGVPLVVLAGCSTAQTATGGGGDGGEGRLPGLARDLLAHGVPAVLAMTTAVTDLYATELTSRLYGELAGQSVVDPLAALADARRAVEAERIGLPASDRRAGLAEWATPALFLRGPSIPLYDPAAGFETIVEPAEPVLAEGIVVRRVGEFVGRRAELRSLLRVLRGDRAGIVVHGLGGTGKSTLAAQLIALLGEQAGLVVSLTGPVAVDQILHTIAGRLSSWSFARNLDDGDVRRRLVDVLRSGQTPWTERVGLLAEHLLPGLPVTLLLDNAEDTLIPDGPGGGQAFLDSQLAAFLTTWIGLPGRAKLLVTSRFPLPVGGEAGRQLIAHHLGPLSVAEARKLLWRLPALDALTPGEQARAITDVGGHPRTLEYLDALLAGGQARFPAIATRLEHALTRRGIVDPAGWYRDVGGDLDRALAETVTLAVDDIVLDDLLARLEGVPHARALLAGASVYRLPVDQTGLAWQISPTVEPAADPDRDTQLAEINRLIGEAQTRGATTLEEIGLTPAQVAVYQDYVEEQRRPPLAVPAGFDHATAALLGLGLLTPVAGADERVAFTVHRWTATAILARTGADEQAAAHRAAAAYWQWHVQVWPQERLADVTDLLEAGHHHLTAGDHDNLWSTTYAACGQLHTWGSWDWEETICRQVLAHLPPTTRLAAAFTHQLGIIAQRRGDYPAAEDRYRQSLTILEEIGDRAGIARSYHRLGIIAQLRGDYLAAEDRYRQSLTIEEEIGDRAGIAASYHQLGMIAELRGDYLAAEDRYRQSLTIEEEIGDRAGIATSYHQLGMIAQARGDYLAAEDRYRQSLTIGEEIGDRAGIAASYHQLGMIAELRGDYPAAEDRYRQSLTILEEIGDRAGIAASYHQLGIIAQLRGDYPAAEDRYHQSLTILEEIGDRAGIAASNGQLGVLYTDQGRAADAVPYTLASLTIHLEIGAPDARLDLDWLGRQREILGDGAFRTIVADHLSGDDVERLLGVLDAAADDGSPTDRGRRAE
jgi:tetratricopeptide (TPR) repeat protein